MTVSGLALDIGFYINRAVLFEVSATPKPGLVDRRNCGAHKDMDFFTFVSSACAIAPYFSKMAQTGIDYDSSDLKGLLAAIRGCGVDCEQAMWAATGGVNTHKGTIFSMGVLAAAAGYSAAHQKSLRPDDVCKTAALMCEGIVSRELHSLNEKKELTNGERLYLLHGVTGIRGEAESGFCTVRGVGLPALEDALRAGLDINSAMLETLLRLMCVSRDTNVLTRAGKDGLDYVMKSAKEALDSGGARVPGGLERLFSLDDDFIGRWVSPGGSADLLSASLFLHDVKNLL